MRFTLILTLGVLLGLPTAAYASSAITPGPEKAARGVYSCPTSMSYSPWIKACSCAPGQSWNSDKKTCTGKILTGAWPKPDIDLFDGGGDINLQPFCAKSPAKITPYDPDHEYCKVGVDTIAFVASGAIIPELESLLGEDLDFEHGDISRELKNIGAGLSGLYLEDVQDSVDLFNTDKFGLGILLSDITDLQPAGLVADTAKRLTCLLSPGKKKKKKKNKNKNKEEEDDCYHDCVAFSTEGCGNFLDVIGDGLGDLLEGLSGLCILDGLLELVGSGGNIVSCVVDDLLCVVGGVLDGLLGLFDCDCDKSRA
jgi:hypothetical protein